ncbi:MAG: AIPR family protein [Deltaproteobacteria bacterium]|nr:AIPR family protein [Deltaproteobacteria bacterium]
MAISLSDKKTEWLRDVRTRGGVNTPDGMFRSKIIKSFCRQELGIDESEFNGDESIGYYFSNQPPEKGGDCAIIYRDEVESESDEDSGYSSELACCLVFSILESPSDGILRANLLRLVRSALVEKQRDGMVLNSSYMRNHFGIGPEISVKVRSVRLIVATCDPLNAAQVQMMSEVIAREGRLRIAEKFDVESYCLNDVFGAEDPDDRIETNLCIESQIEAGKLRFAICTVSSLFEFMESYRISRGMSDISSLYEKNVRGFLSSRGAINKGIARTLAAEPENFALYNNGLTIVADEVKVPGQAELKLVNPYIVNGCQTSNVIYKSMREYKAKKNKQSNSLHVRMASSSNNLDGKSFGNSEDISIDHQAKVLVKIVAVSHDDEHLCTNIVRFSNSQNAVKEKDFIALNEQFRIWHDALLKNRDLYLEIQKGRWDSYKAAHPKTCVEMINVTDVLKIYASAWLRKAGTAMSRNVDFGPKGKIFEQVINLDPVVDEADLYAAFLLKREAQRLGYGLKQGEPDDPRRLTRYLFYLVCGDLVRMAINDWSTGAAKLISQVILELSDVHHDKKRSLFFDTADRVIGRYFGRSSVHSVEAEIAFTAASRDPNKFLKSSSLADRDQAERYKIYFEKLEFMYSESGVEQLIRSLLPSRFGRAS